MDLSAVMVLCLDSRILIDLVARAESNAVKLEIFVPNNK